MKNLVFIVQGYELQSDTGGLSDVVTLELFADTEKEAIDRAKKLITKKFYRIAGVVEKQKEEHGNR